MVTQQELTLKVAHHQFLKLQLVFFFYVYVF